MDEKKTLGKILKELLARQGWTQKTLARKAGIAQSAVSQLTLGDITSPTLDVAERIANAFGVSLDSLVDGREHMVDNLAPDEQEWLALYRSIPPGEIRESLLESARIFARTFAGTTTGAGSGVSRRRSSSR